jgi:hypothetical protein
VSVPSQGSEWSSICVLGGIDILGLSTILIFDFVIVQTVWYFVFFIVLLIDIECFHTDYSNKLLIKVVSEESLKIQKVQSKAVNRRKKDN